MFLSKYSFTLLWLLLNFSIEPRSAFDDHDMEHDHETSTGHHETGPLPKDKVLLNTIKTLTFHRNKRTTSRRTYPIHQLSCVGGTAGCKLFTPNVVECENIGYDKEKSKFNWECHADISDRVKFNHVEVICEGYNYPEDDYILLGSCGLEFTLDYADPHDFHHHSYFKHMDDHEKQLHHDRVRANAKPKESPSPQPQSYIDRVIEGVSNNIVLIGIFLLLVMCSCLLLRYLATGPDKDRSPTKKGRASNYGPLASAVLTTKKAC